MSTAGRRGRARRSGSRRGGEALLLRGCGGGGHGALLVVSGDASVAPPSERPPAGLQGPCNAAPARPLQGLLQRCGRSWWDDLHPVPPWRPHVSAEPTPWVAASSTSSSRGPPTGSRSAPPTPSPAPASRRLRHRRRAALPQGAVGRGRLDHAGDRQRPELGVQGLAGRPVRSDSRRSSTTPSSAWRWRATGPAARLVDPDDRLRRRPGAAAATTRCPPTHHAGWIDHMAAMHAHFLGWRDDLGLAGPRPPLAVLRARARSPPSCEVADVPGPDRRRRPGLGAAARARAAARTTWSRSCTATPTR